MFAYCSHGLPPHIRWMASARQRAIAEKRRRGVRPYCRKRTLTPKAIVQSDQSLGPNLAELISKNEKYSPTSVSQQSNKRGAPFGNRNALRNGKYTSEHRALYGAIRAHIREGQRLVAWVRLLSQFPSPPQRGGEGKGEGVSQTARDLRQPPTPALSPTSVGKREKLDWGYPIRSDCSQVTAAARDSIKPHDSDGRDIVRRNAGGRFRFLRPPFDRNPAEPRAAPPDPRAARDRGGGGDRRGAIAACKPRSAPRRRRLARARAR